MAKASSTYDVLLARDVLDSPVPPPRRRPPPPQSWLSRNRVVLAWSAFAILSNVAQIVTLYKIGQRAPTYSFTILTASCFLFNVPFLLYAYGRHALYNTITPSMTTASVKGKMFVIGAFLALNGVMILSANPHVNGPLQTILLQSAVPVIMLTSIVCIGARYSLLQYVAALLVIAGVVVTLVPDIRDHELTGAEAKWIVIFFLGSVPAAFNLVGQEWLYKQLNHKLDIAYFMAWTNIFQGVALLFLWPLDLIPGFGSTTSVRDFGEHFYHGLRCFYGEQAPDLAEGSCHLIWVNELAFVVAYVCANIASSGLTKYSTAAFSILVSVTSTILANIAFSLRFIMKSHTSSLNGWDVAGLAIVVVGTIMYRLFTVDGGSDGGKVTPHDPLLADDGWESGEDGHFYGYGEAYGAVEEAPQRH